MVVLYQHRDFAISGRGQCSHPGDFSNSARHGGGSEEATQSFLRRKQCSNLKPVPSGEELWQRSCSVPVNFHNAAVSGSVNRTPRSQHFPIRTSTVQLTEEGYRKCATAFDASQQFMNVYANLITRPTAFHLHGALSSSEPLISKQLLNLSLSTSGFVSGMVAPRLARIHHFPSPDSWGSIVAMRQKQSRKSPIQISPLPEG